MASATAVQNEAAFAAGGEVLADAARYGAAATLMDSLLHDARNPLNALAINLEVLTEKLKGEGAEVPPAQEKNLRAMRDQIGRLDGILRQFSDFIAPRPAGQGPVPLSEVVLRALEVLGHESRRKRLKLRTAVDADLVARPAELAAVRFLVLQPLLRAFRRAEVGTEVVVSLRRAGAEAVLEVEDSATEAPDSAPEVLAALECEASRAEARVLLRGGLCQVAFILS